MKLQETNSFLQFEMEKLRPRWKVEMGLTIFCGGGGLFVFEKYDRFYASTRQSIITGAKMYEPLALYRSNDGYRAFLWLETYIQLILTEEWIPSFIDVVCERNYQQELRNTFGSFHTISADDWLFEKLGRERIQKDNAAYIFESLEELHTLMCKNGKLFREITRNDME